MRFITIEKIKNNYSKCSAFASSAPLHLLATSNSVIFVSGGARIFLAPGAGYPSYATA